MDDKKNFINYQNNDNNKSINYSQKNTLENYQEKFQPYKENQSRPKSAAGHAK
jgi:hypothetical protein